MHKVTDNHQNTLHHRNSKAVATIWLVFYGLAGVVAIVPSLVSGAIEVATR